MQVTVVYLDLFGRGAQVVVPGLSQEIAFGSPFPMVGYLALPRCSGEGLCPATTLCDRFC